MAYSKENREGKRAAERRWRRKWRARNRARGLTSHGETPKLPNRCLPVLEVPVFRHHATDDELDRRAVQWLRRMYGADYV